MTTNSVGDLWTWREALVKARINGVREVRDFNGSAVIYRSDAEMAAAIAAADREIAAKSGALSPPKTILFTTSKGL